MGTIDLTHCENGLDILDWLDAHETVELTEVKHKSIDAVKFVIESSRYVKFSNDKLPDGWEIRSVYGLPRGEGQQSEMVVSLGKQR